MNIWNNLLLSGFFLLILGGSVFADETDASLIQRLESEIRTLNQQVSDPSLSAQRRFLEQQLFEKIRQLQSLQREIKNSPATRDGTNPFPAPQKKTQAPAPVAQNPPVSPAAPSAKEPVTSKTVSSLDFDSAPMESQKFILHSAEELHLGLGTQQTLDQIANLLKEQDLETARSEWVSYLQGEMDVLKNDAERVEGIVNYIVRRECVDSDNDLAPFAASVDAAKLKKDPDSVSKNQADFDKFLSARQDLLPTIQKSLQFLHKILKNTYP